MNPVDKLRSTATIDDPLRLAALYKAGLGKNWSNFRQAAEEFSIIFGTNVRAGTVQQAVKVSTFPPEILDLFRHVGIVNRTARELIRTCKEFGFELPLQRAKALNADDMPRGEIIAKLRGEESTTKRRRAAVTAAPLVTRSVYSEGVATGAWTSARRASTQLNISRHQIDKAGAIAALPREVLTLFPDRRLTTEVGKKLLHLLAIRGEDAIRQAAVELGNVIPRPSTKRVLTRLAGLDQRGVELKVKKVSGRFVIEFHCDVDSDKLDVKMHMLVLWAHDALELIRKE